MLNIPEEFKRTLSEQEFLDYFLKYKEGDQKARDILISHNLKLIPFVLKSFSNITYDVEELEEEGLIGLIKALNTYDTSKSKFSTYAINVIKNQILMLLRKREKLDLMFKINILF